MDITVLFKACVKTIRLRNKSSSVETPTNILHKNRDNNLKHAKVLLHEMSRIYEMLSYSKTSMISTGKQGKLPLEEDLQNSDVETAINVFSNQLHQLRNDFSQKIVTKQQAEHYANVFLSLESYYRELGKLYAGKKAVKIKRALDARKIGKLEIEDIKERSLASSSSASLPVIPDVSPQIDPSDQLTSEELQLFESENSQLLQQLTEVTEEVQQVQRKVVAISELQDLFTERVLQQEKDIDRINMNVVASTENVKDANEQIRQAIQRNAGLRVWVLFFLLVMSLSLLFLDWYND